MPYCVRANNNGRLIVGDQYDGTNTQANCDFVIEQSTEYLANPSAQLEPLFDKYFGFDGELFSIIVGLTLATFVTGVSTGHVVRILRRT